MDEESFGTTDSSPTAPLYWRKTLRLVVVGKSGTGKSTLCNQLAGEDKFPVGHGLSSCTTEHQELQVNDGLVVVDTSDNMQEVVYTQKPLATTDHLCKVVIVFCIRCDSRFAVEEYSIYKELKDLWGDEADFRQRLIVAFTHGDSLDGEPYQAMGEMLKVAWSQLQAVVRDANKRFVVFVKQEQGNADLSSVTKLLDIAHELDVNCVTKPSPIRREERLKGSQPVTDNSSWRNWKTVLLLATVFLVVLTFFVRSYNITSWAIIVLWTIVFLLLLAFTSYIFRSTSKKMCLLQRRNLGNTIP